VQVNCEGRDGFNFYDDCDVSGLQNVPIHRQVTGGRFSRDWRVFSDDPFGLQ
jgi:hypothetical protein